MSQDRSQRTEQPTGKRLAKARSEGNVPRTKELSSALGLAGFLVFAHLFGSDWLGRLKQVLVDGIESIAHHEMNANDALIYLGTMASSTGMLLFLPLGFMLVAGVGGNLVQGPPPFTFKPFQPDLKRLNPISGLKKLFKLRGWVEMLKTLLKMAFFTTIAVFAVKQAMLEGLPGAPGAEGAFLAIATLCGKVIFRIAAVALGLSVLDMLFTRYDHRRQLMMTKQEIKDERKEGEGDPLIKARLRSKQMQLSRSRMMAEVPRASVVITNPTHYAVALRYVPGDTDVPQLLAKGRGKIAQKIREVALAAGVPIISDPPLARALFRSVQVGSFIPQALFRAVAEVLAVVLRGEGRRRRSPLPGEHA